jgi:hypothetical protein
MEPVALLWGVMNTVYVPVAGRVDKLTVWLLPDPLRGAEL